MKQRGVYLFNMTDSGGRGQEKYRGNREFRYDNNYLLAY